MLTIGAVCSARHQLATKLEQAATKTAELEAAQHAHATAAARARWRWALERLTTGACLCTSISPPASAADATDDEESSLVPPASSSAQHECDDDDDGDVADSASAKHPVGGACRWLWLYRGVYAAHRSSELAAAERVLLEAETGLKRPPLNRRRELPTDHLAFDALTKGEREQGLVVQSRPVKPISDVRTAEDAEFNRALQIGRLRHEAVVEV